MKYVLDASAILAFLNNEPGADQVETALGDALVSSVNVVEVGTRLVDAGMPEGAAMEALQLLNLPTASFEMRTAQIAIGVRTDTRPAGLSLGDRCCLALAIQEQAIALTADRAWADLPIECTVELIR